MCPSERTFLRARSALALAFGAILLPGCVEHGLHQYMTPFDYAPIEAPPPEPPAEGAIWPGDTPSGSFLFFDQKARGVGDLVTVFVEEDVLAEGSASTDLSRDATANLGLSSDVGFQGMVSQGIRDALEFLGVDDPGTDVPSDESLNVLASETQSEFSGQGATRRSGRFRGVVTCRVVAVLPGPVFHIRGRRSLLVNHEEQFVTVEGLVRPEDISINNAVRSTALAEARLAFDGVGVVDDKQRPGWLARVLDWVYPF